MIDEFISQFRERTPSYVAWASFVTSEIKNFVEGNGRKHEEFFKIPPKSRTKLESSIRGKAGRYGLHDFKAEIRDLIGVRFVVLLTSELLLVEKAITSNPTFSWEKVRDYGVQTDSNPELFEYQSIHYLLRPTKEFSFEDQIIDLDIECEVQIRTLLQHAYAELTHDNIYKPFQLVPTSARRLVARSMALMETTDELFCGTLDALREANGPRNDLLRKLDEFYSYNIDSENILKDTKINLEVIDMFRTSIDFNVIFENIEAFSLACDPLFDFIRSRQNSTFLFSQPIIFLLYYLVSKKQDNVREKWNLLSLTEEIRLVFSDLNIAFGDEL